jgi:hypothetical protein
MIKFNVITARQSRNGKPDVAEVVADYMTDTRIEQLKEEYRLVQVLPAKAHWTTTIVPAREGSDWDQKTEA